MNDLIPRKKHDVTKDQIKQARKIVKEYNLFRARCNFEGTYRADFRAKWGPAHCRRMRRTYIAICRAHQIASLDLRSVNV